LAWLAEFSITTIRLPVALHRRIAHLGDVLSQTAGGLQVTKTKVLQLCIERGLESLEKRAEKLRDQMADFTEDVGDELEEEGRETPDAARRFGT